MKTQETHQKISSLDNALSVLDLFSADEPELKLNEIAEKLRVANSTAHRLVATLMSEGFVTKDRHTNMYRLGSSILALGNIIQSEIKLVEASNPILQALVEQAQETAHIAKLKDGDVIYLSKMECSHPFRLLSHIGKRNPAHCTSSGQVLLAYQSETAIEQFLQRKLESYTPTTITDPSSFQLLLRNIKKTGHAVSREQLHEGVTSISAPIRNHKDQVIACVTVAGPVTRININTIPRLTDLVIQSADKINQILKA